MKTSWKTTACGILGVVAAVAIAAKNYLDGDPATSVDFQSVLTALAVFAPSVAAIFARDNDKSSESVGAK